MPFYRLLVLIAVVLSLAAVTVAIVLMATDLVSLSPPLKLAGLSLTVLCATLAWRVFSNRGVTPK